MAPVKMVTAIGHLGKTGTSSTGVKPSPQKPSKNLSFGKTNYRLWRGDSSYGGTFWHHEGSFDTIGQEGAGLRQGPVERLFMPWPNKTKTDSKKFQDTIKNQG